MIFTTFKNKILGFFDEHIFFFGILGLVLTLAWTIFSPADKLFEKKKEVMVSPEDYRRHLEIAEVFLENNDYLSAKREFDLAISLKEGFLTSQARVDKKDKVLGEENLFEKIKERILEPERLQEEIVRWKEVIREKPDYRDGYLKLAVLFWKVGKTSESRENLDRALKLDPNYDLALELKGIIK